MNNLYSISDCSRLLGGLPEYKISYAHRSGKLPEPKFRLSNRRAYTRTELETMASYFGVRLEDNEKDNEDD